MHPHLSSLALSVMPLFGLGACHGSLHVFFANGKSYQGDNPTNPQNLTTPIRLRGDGDVGPVLGATNPALLCGLKAAVAKETALADPGSILSFSWKSGGLEGNWPHEAGPVMAYMTDCQGSCTEFQPAMDTPWFKIDEAGLKPGTANDWVQKDIHGGSPYNLTLPGNIKSSEYLLRIEIIALHRASERNGAEFYPSCVQVQVGGNGDGVPNTTVTFSNAYSDDDPGIYIPQMYDGFKVKDYVFPGGPIASMTSSGAAGDDDHVTTNSVSSTSVDSKIASATTSQSSALPSESISVSETNHSDPATTNESTTGTSSTRSSCPRRTGQPSKRHGGSLDGLRWRSRVHDPFTRRFRVGRAGPM